MGWTPKTTLAHIVCNLSGLAHLGKQIWLVAGGNILENPLSWITSVTSNANLGFGVHFFLRVHFGRRNVI